MSTKSNQPNYRIYDQTGGGVTEDIYAESLEDAIRKGREWIEGGCWEALSYDQTLSCAVVEIVRDEDGDIDEDATWEAKRHDCSGTLAAAEGPECSAGEHDWRSPFSLVGGIKENPGVWGSGHGKVSTKEVCACCGCYRMINYGATESATGQNVTTTNYEPADDASRAWLMRRLNLPDEIEIKGATVTLEWDKSADITEEDEALGQAIHAVPSADLDEGTANGPSDGETFEVNGVTFRLGSHDYETNGDETTCTASIYRRICETHGVRETNNESKNMNIIELKDTEARISKITNDRGVVTVELEWGGPSDRTVTDFDLAQLGKIAKGLGIPPHGGNLCSGWAILDGECDLEEGDTIPVLDADT